jgi:hypothetical protein
MWRETEKDDDASCRTHVSGTRTPITRDPYDAMSSCRFHVFADIRRCGRRYYFDILGQYSNETDFW